MAERGSVCGRWARALCVALIVGAMGCRSDGTMSIPMPRRIVDLSPVITEDLIVRQLGYRASEFLGLAPRIPFEPVVPSKEAYAFGLTYFRLVSNLGAHIDPSGRLVKGGERSDQVPLERLYGRARLVDLRWKDRNSPLQITDLESYTIQSNEIVLLFVGYSHPEDEEWPAYPPLSLQAAKWLAQKNIRALATDMPSVGSFSRYADLMDKDRPPEEVWQERLVFAQAGIPVVQGLTNLGSLLGEKNVVFVGFPLAIADRGGAPMRAAALVF